MERIVKVVEKGSESKRDWDEKCRWCYGYGEIVNKKTGLPEKCENCQGQGGYYTYGIKDHGFMWDGGTGTMTPGLHLNTREPPLPAGQTAIETVTETREVKRQITVAGNKIDVRSGRVFEIMTPPIQNLIDVAPCWIQQLGNERDLSVRRRIRLDLQRLVQLRGHELPPNLKTIILTILAQGSALSSLDSPSKWEIPPLPPLDPSTERHPLTHKSNVGER